MGRNCFYSKRKNYLTSLSNHAKNFTLEKPVVDTLVTKALKKIMLLFKLLLQQKSNHSFR